MYVVAVHWTCAHPDLCQIIMYYQVAWYYAVVTGSNFTVVEAIYVRKMGLFCMYTFVIEF